jgi:hypothetical protein
MDSGPLPMSLFGNRCTPQSRPSRPRLPLYGVPIWVKGKIIFLAFILGRKRAEIKPCFFPFVSYPYGQTVVAGSTPADIAALDTNGDGTVDAGDDPYGPYYPVCACCLVGFELLALTRQFRGTTLWTGLVFHCVRLRARLRSAGHS